MADARLKIWTIGHSTRSFAELVDLLGRVSIDLLVDVRSVPRSRTNPQFNADVLPTSLAEQGIALSPFPALGGLRGPRKDGVPSLNTLWRNTQLPQLCRLRRREHCLPPRARRN